MTNTAQSLSQEELISQKQQEVQNLRVEVEEKQKQITVLHQELTAAQTKLTASSQELNQMQAELNAKALKQNWKAWIYSFLKNYPNSQLHYRTDIYRAAVEDGVLFLDEKTGEEMPADTQYRKVNEYLWSLVDDPKTQVKKGQKRGTFIFSFTVPTVAPVAAPQHQLSLPVPFFPPVVGENPRYSQIREEIYQNILHGGFTKAGTSKQTFVNRCLAEGLDMSGIDIDYMNSYLDEHCQAGGTLSCFKKHLGITGEVSVEYGYQGKELPHPGEGWMSVVPPLKQRPPAIKRRLRTVN